MNSKTHFCRKVCGVMICILLLAQFVPAAVAAPAVPNGQLVFTRQLELTVGERVLLPVGDVDSTIWDVDGDAVQMLVPGELWAVRPGVAHVIAQGSSETTMFTVRVKMPQKDAEPNDEEPLVTYAEGIWSDIDSGCKYCIAVNKQENCVTVYTLDEDGRYTIPVDVMICSTGPDTPLGTFFMGEAKVRWCDLFGDVWGQYISVIDGNILFHSVPYVTDSEDTLRTDYFNLLGTSCSMGCIRLLVEDAYWIYWYCEGGTPIVIYEDDDPGPWERPEAPILGDGCTWDPTDHDERNPWHTGTPELTVQGRIRYAEPYSKPNLLHNVTAVDSGGGDALHLVEVMGYVDTTRDGTYPVTYTFTDIKGRTASASAVYIVEGAD